MNPSSALCRVAEPVGSDPVRFEIETGLRQTPKSLPCKLFYDARGSRLFEEICELEEYYLTRTELAILRSHAEEMAEALGPQVALLEFGSGASIKTRLLLDALDDPRMYVPIEISRSALRTSCRVLEHTYPTLQVRPVCGDYTAPLSLPPSFEAGPVAAFFPGSTMGNFEPAAAVDFLGRIRTLLGRAGKLLIGIDLPKDRATLEAAYNDRRGVTAAFNLNILRVINRRHGGHFPLRTFVHQAPWNATVGRIEMRLVSTNSQSIAIGSRSVRFDTGEPIITEYCYKYDVGQFRVLAEQGGFDVVRIWTDPARKFSVQLLEAR